MNKTNFYLAAVMSAAVSSPAHASPAAPSGAQQAPSPRHVQPVLPSASRGIMLEAPWPTTGQAWTRLDRDMDLRVKRMTLNELESVMAQAKAGSAIAQTLLGMVFREGTDRSAFSGAGATGGLATLRGQMNNDEAIKWLGKAAEQGFPMAQVEIGEMYYRGHGVMRDIDQAIAWTEMAAKADYPRAQLNLMQMRIFKAAEDLDHKVLLHQIGGRAPQALLQENQEGAAGRK